MWESLAKRVFALDQVETELCLMQLRINIRRFSSLSFGVPSSHPRAAFMRRRKKCQSGNSRICAQMVMTDNKRAQVAIPYQDRRNLSCLAWFSSPRGTTCNTNFRREMRQIRRMSHGSARSIEGLRKLRLSLVPSPDTRYCVLQRVSVEIANVSNPGKP
jgi:hypothetical protein